MENSWRCWIFVLVTDLLKWLLRLSPVMRVNLSIRVIPSLIHTSRLELIIIIIGLIDIYELKRACP